jgi:hypothetical protein
MSRKFRIDDARTRAALAIAAAVAVGSSAAMAQGTPDPKCGLDPSCGGKSSIPGGVERMPPAPMPPAALPLVRGDSAAMPSMAVTRSLGTVPVTAPEPAAEGKQPEPKKPPVQ